jgi:N-acetyl-1-D-myo-inositol-2-amino-2-deoxy-alpha-D-glucopyranoside deacetylase
VGPLLALFPHPDDETFTAAGVMVAAAAREIRVTVICATRGEAGESSIRGLASAEELGQIRERELRAAMACLGVVDVQVLGFCDSGMPGSADALHPRAFVRADVHDAAMLLVPKIRELRPQTIITFGPDGIYGHPDHLHMHKVAVHAVILSAGGSPEGPEWPTPWRTPAAYFATFPREDMTDIMDRPGSPLASLPPDTRNRIGTPRAEITHVVDITRWSSAKRAAIAAHISQTAEGGPLAHIPDEAISRQVTREYFVRFATPWDDDSSLGRDIISILAAGRGPD